MWSTAVLREGKCWPVGDRNSALLTCLVPTITSRRRVCHPGGRWLAPSVHSEQPGPWGRPPLYTTWKYHELQNYQEQVSDLLGGRGVGQVPQVGAQVELLGPGRGAKLT